MDDKSIFLHVLEQEDPARRKLLLEEMCGDDPELRRRIEELLHYHEEIGSFLGQPILEKAEGNMPTSAGPATPENSGEQTKGGFPFLQSTQKPGCLGLLGEYEVLELIGRGGMGMVFRAHEPRLNRIVAIKVLSPALSTQANAVQRFLREARAAAAVNHPNVVSIYSVEEKHQPPYLVMEFVAGRSLQEKIDATGGLGVKEILRIGLQTAAGIAAAHAQGLVHRDIKPSNILLENGVERVKITDFGLARAVDEVGLTRTGTILGTPQYMAPEQAGGESVDGRSDLFSLGSVLYAMASGRPPFRGNSTIEVIRKVCESEPRALPEINPEIPNWLVEIITKLMAKKKENRFASAAQVAELLEAHLAHIQQPRTTPRPPRLELDAPGKRQREPRKPWSPTKIVLVVILCLLALPVLGCFASILLYFLSYSGDPGNSSNNPGAPIVEKEKFLGLAAFGHKDQVELWLKIQHLPQLVPLQSVQLPLPRNAKLRQGRISPNGRYLAVISDYQLTVIDLTTQKKLHELQAIWSGLAFSPEGQHLAFFEPREDGQNSHQHLCLLDLKTGKKRILDQSLNQTFQTVLSLAFSQDGMQLALGGEYTFQGKTFARVVLCNVQSGKYSANLDMPGESVWSVALSPNDQQLLAVGSQDPERYAKGKAPVGAVLLELQSKKEIGELAKITTGREQWLGAGISPEGKLAFAIRHLPTWNRQMLYFWDTKTGKRLSGADLVGLGTIPDLSGLVLSPDGKSLVVPTFLSDPVTRPTPSGTIYGMVIDLENRRPSIALWANDGITQTSPLALGYAEDGKTLLTVDRLGKLHRWGSPPNQAGK